MSLAKRISPILGPKIFSLSISSHNFEIKFSNAIFSPEIDSVETPDSNNHVFDASLMLSKFIKIDFGKFFVRIVSQIFSKMDKSGQSWKPAGMVEMTLGDRLVGRDLV